mgnify:CR=1 FL=1
MKIMVTGATGFIGSHLIEYLVKDGVNEISIIKRSSSNIWRIREHIDTIKSYDVDKKDITKIVEEDKPEMIIHLATFYKKNHAFEDISSMISSNIEFPTKILEAMVLVGVKYFINTGTFFEKNYDVSFSNPLGVGKPVNLYASTKLAFEEMLKFYTFNYDIKAITLKLFSPYGYKENSYKLIPYLIRSIMNGEKVGLTQGEQLLDFTYVKDIVSAYINSIKYITCMKENYQDFEVGTGTPHTVREVAEILSEISGIDSNLEWGAIPYADNEIFYSKADISKTMNCLKWKPKYSLGEGLQETFNQYKGEKNGGREYY